MPFVELKTGATFYYDHLNPNAGGIPVVLLHGLLGTGRAHLGQVMDWLAGEGYEVYAPSLRGYGESTPKPRDFPFRFYDRDANDVIAFLEVLNLTKIHLFGYSDGGEISLITSGKVPERIVTVTTVGAVGFMGADVRPVVQSYRPGSQWITQEELDMHGITNADAFGAAWQRATIMLIDSGGDVAVSLAPNITANVLLMLGDRDYLNPRSCAEKFMAGVKKGRIEMFDAGHPIHDEQIEAFRKMWLAHLKAND